jgi:Ca2+-binding RTX toxin-like protein
VLLGGPGDDTLTYVSGVDIMDGGVGVDVANFEQLSESPVVLDLSKNQFVIDSDVYQIINIESVQGSNQSDILTGDQGANSLYGLDGDDMLFGGAGTDHLYGGSGSDVYKFSALEDMGVGEGSRDIIFDFDPGTDVTSNDLIDLTGLVGSEFTFLNEALFTSDGTVAQIRVERSAASSLVEIDLDNDAQADAQIELSGNDGVGLNQDDFIVG